MINQLKKKIKIDKYMLILIFATIVGFGILFRLYNVYPFGSEAINLIDFDAGYVPAYYKLWDVLHFQSTMWFDWNLGLGLNGFGTLLNNGMISPLCWIIAIFPRDSIPYTISYIYLIKMIFISIIAYIVIGKIFPKTEGKIKVLFTLMYTFSGWTFMMSENLLYLEAVALYPLVVYGLKELLEHGKWKTYFIVLTLTLICSYYIAWLDLFFIIGCTGIALLTMKTDHKKEKAVKVLLFTGLALLLSSVIFLPAFMVAKQSARMANNTSTDTIFSYFMDKAIYLFTLAIPFVLTVRQLFVKKDKRLNIFILVMLVFLLLGVVIEPINALWHTGSHSGFPFRYSYQPAFFTILVSIYYLNNNMKYKEKTSWTKTLIPLAACIAAFGLFLSLRVELLDRNQFSSKLSNWPDFICLIAMFVFLIISYIFTLRNSKKVSYVLTCVLFVATTIIYGNLYLEFLGRASADPIQNTFEVFNTPDDGYNYMTDLNYANMNYPYIVKRPSIQNRFHFIRKEQLELINALGFYNSDTMVYSYGGTEVSNTLMQNKYFFTTKEYDDNYYTLLESKEMPKQGKDETETVNLYEYKYNINYLIPYNGKDYNEISENVFDNINNIYKNMFDGEKDIYIPLDSNYKYEDDVLSFTVKKGKKYKIRLKYDGVENYKYLNSDEDLIYERSSFRENEALIDIRVLKDFVFKLQSDGELKEIKVYELDEKELENFVEKTKLDNVKIETIGKLRKYELDLEEDKHILIPIHYDPAFIIKVNGEVVDYKCNLYGMIAIDLNKGHNVIEIEYSHKWLGIGAIISAITLLIIIAFYFINKKIRLLNIKFILWPLFIVSCLVFAALIIKVYILSWI